MNVNNDLLQCLRSIMLLRKRRKFHRSYTVMGVAALTPWPLLPMLGEREENVRLRAARSR